MKEIVLTEKQLVDLIDEIEEKALLKFSSNQLQPLAWKAKIIKKAMKMSEKRKLSVNFEE